MEFPGFIGLSFRVSGIYVLVLVLYFAQFLCYYHGNEKAFRCLHPVFPYVGFRDISLKESRDKAAFDVGNLLYEKNMP